MLDLLSRVGADSVTQSALVALVVAIALLFVVTLAFSAYAILLRIRNEVRGKRWERLTAMWQQPVLEALADPSKAEAVHKRVEERFRRHFVQFVLEYIRRVRGEERTVLRELALPYLDLIAERADHRRAEVRTRAIQTLGTLGLPAYADLVVKALDDPSPLVSMVAARYVARQDFPEFAEPVLEHLGRFEGWNRRFLASMLATMGPDIAHKLRDGLADDSRPDWVRSVLADALLMQLDPLAADVAARVVVTSEDRELLASVLRLLAAVGRPGHAAVIRARCASPDFVIRAQALNALGVLSDDEDLPLLREAMNDPSPWVALHAARGVREAGGEAYLAELARSEGPKAALAGQVLFEEGDR